MAKPLFGQINTIGSAQQLDPNDTAAPCVAFVIAAPISNAAGVFLGDSTVTPSNGHQMDPGVEYTYERLAQQGAGVLYQSRVSDLWVWIVATGDKFTWLGFQ